MCVYVYAFCVYPLPSVTDTADISLLLSRVFANGDGIWLWNVIDESITDVANAFTEFM